jgi:hypothetical protein
MQASQPSRLLTARGQPLQPQHSSVENDFCNSTAQLVLVLSSVLHEQTCQVMSLSERRPSVSLQVIVWQKGIQFGVVCFDRTLRDIHLVQPTSLEQETICLPLQAAGSEEIAINMSLYSTSLTYQEEVPPSPLPLSSTFSHLL